MVDYGGLRKSILVLLSIEFTDPKTVIGVPCYLLRLLFFDIALVAHSAEVMQSLVEKFARAAS